VFLALPELGPIRAERVVLPQPTGDLFARLRGVAHLAVLDSGGQGRFTLVAASPMARMIWGRGGGEVAIPGGARVREREFETLLRECLSATAAPRPGPLPFGPGWIGLFGYGLRTAFEEVPERHPDETAIADVDLSYYPAVAVHDARDDCWWQIWRDGAENAARTLGACLRSPAPPPAGGVTGPPAPSISKSAYLAAVAKAVEYIRAGDIFQVNYAHEFRAPFAGSPLALYRALRASNPAPYGAFLDLGRGAAVLSTSPELFLELRGRAVTTRPIKGTRRRGADPEEDRALAAELASSAKDHAELAMIIDLERNDLGRVCRPGTIRVADPGSIESFATVHHRVATVEGEIEEGIDRVDLLAATFPGGSITGAPKVRAMEIIDELEAARRGAYTGSIGILTDDGGMDLNIAIRTATLAGGVVRIAVGGGIVADSDPEAEYEETLAKGAGMFRALEP